MPVDCLKVHRSFVRRFAEKGLQAGIAGAIIALARTHGLRVVAEGVDTVEQLDFAVSHGCDEAQGDVFCPPLPADALAPLLASGIVSGPWPAS
jgi:EAL domain-containing protein (putative c-di-GMP-specific phosphodiesterase class I)